MVDDNPYDSEGHIVKWLAPSGTLHDSAGFIDKNEHLILTVGLSIADELEKLQDLGNKAEPADVTNTIIKSFKNLNHSFLNLSASREGKRSKQLIQKLKGGKEDTTDKDGWLSRNVSNRNKDKNDPTNDVR